ncbi:hypothetical protein [Streptomyces nigrescens]|uniref:hypothetical protein n=1 Tax=Streptomyces nigrescens TaxID=1920 RepID=UPI003700726A
MLVVAIALGLFLAGFITGGLFIGHECDIRIADRRKAVHSWLIRREAESRHRATSSVFTTIALALLHPLEFARLLARKLTGLRHTTK